MLQSDEDFSVKGLIQKIGLFYAHCEPAITFFFESGSKQKVPKKKPIAHRTV